MKIHIQPYHIYTALRLPSKNNYSAKTEGLTVVIYYISFVVILF
jgi:hypothetical protein